MRRLKFLLSIVSAALTLCLDTPQSLFSAEKEAEPTVEQSRFAGFPKLSKPGKKTLEVLTSDGVKGLVRPKWTRAMADEAAWPAMFRFQKRIYLYFPRVNGHRGPYRNNDLPIARYVSDDEGKSWQALPEEKGRQVGEFVIRDGTIFRYDFDDLTQTRLRTSTDGLTWSEGVKVYKPGFWLWGVAWDPVTKMFYAPPHANPKKVKVPRQIQLLKSKDGVEWEYVSTVHSQGSESESTLMVEPDKSLVILMRKKYSSDTSWVARAKPPYTKWDVTTRPYIAEGEHFFTIAGQTFLPSRAVYKGDDPRVLASPKIGDPRRSYSMVHKFTKDRQLVPWAVMDSLGDCSYPWLVETPTEVLCAYYSQHEDKCCKVFLCAYDKEAFLKGP